MCPNSFAFHSQFSVKFWMKDPQQKEREKWSYSMWKEIIEKSSVPGVCLIQDPSWYFACSTFDRWCLIDVFIKIHFLDEWISEGWENWRWKRSIVMRFCEAKLRCPWESIVHFPHDSRPPIIHFNEATVRQNMTQLQQQKNRLRILLIHLALIGNRVDHKSSHEKRPNESAITVSPRGFPPLWCIQSQWFISASLKTHKSVHRTPQR